MSSEVAVIILNYNTWKRTLEAVEMLHNVLETAADDIYVIDNASPNDSYQCLESVCAGRFHLLKSDSNAGYAAGNNQGLRYVRQKGYRYAWVLNNDVIVEDKELVSNMLDILKSDDKIAEIHPDIYAPDGHLFNREEKYPTFWDYTLGMFHYRKIGRKIKDLGGYGYVYRPQGCCMLLDLAKSEEAGDMDEHTFLYGEEFILAERFLQRGYVCACYTGGKVLHDHSTTVRELYTKKKVMDMKLESFRYYLTAYRKYSKFKVRIAAAFYRWKLELLEL